MTAIIILLYTVIARSTRTTNDAMAAKVFISYRRDDSKYQARMIHAAVLVSFLPDCAGEGVVGVDKSPTYGGGHRGNVGTQGFWVSRRRHKTRHKGRRRHWESDELFAAISRW